MKPDIVVGASLEGALKRLKRIHGEIRKETKKHRWHVKPSDVRRLMKKRGRARWLKKEARLKRAAMRGD